MRTLRNLMIVIGAVAVLGMAVNVFAHGGMGWGAGWGHRGGQGWHHQGGYGSGPGDGLSQEQLAQIDEQREAFFKETEDIRTALYEKQGDLQDELANTEPDAAMASLLQKEISDLQARVDQMRIDHMIEMRKLNPDAGRGYMGQGPKQGRGANGGGPCWR